MRFVDDDDDWEEVDQSEGDWYVRDYVIAPRDARIAELEARIRELESDVEYYKYEASRTW